MTDKFLGTGSVGGNIANGTISIYGSKIGAKNLGIVVLFIAVILLCCNASVEFFKSIFHVNEMYCDSGGWICTVFPSICKRWLINHSTAKG